MEKTINLVTFFKWVFSSTIHPLKFRNYEGVINLSRTTWYSHFVTIAVRNSPIHVAVTEAELARLVIVRFLGGSVVPIKATVF